jgi:hypothetical protein
MASPSPLDEAFFDATDDAEDPESPAIAPQSLGHKTISFFGTPRPLDAGLRVRLGDIRATPLQVDLRCYRITSPGRE